MTARENPADSAGFCRRGKGVSLGKLFPQDGRGKAFFPGGEIDRFWAIGPAVEQNGAGPRLANFPADRLRSRQDRGRSGGGWSKSFSATRFRAALSGCRFPAAPGATLAPRAPRASRPPTCAMTRKSGPLKPPGCWWPSYCRRRPAGPGALLGRPYAPPRPPPPGTCLRRRPGWKA